MEGKGRQSQAVCCVVVVVYPRRFEATDNDFPDRRFVISCLPASSPSSSSSSSVVLYTHAVTQAVASFVLCSALLSARISRISRRLNSRGG